MGSHTVERAAPTGRPSMKDMGIDPRRVRLRGLTPMCCSDSESAVEHVCFAGRRLSERLGRIPRRTFYRAAQNVAVIEEK